MKATKKTLIVRCPADNKPLIVRQKDIVIDDKDCTMTWYECQTCGYKGPPWTYEKRVMRRIAKRKKK